MSVLDGTDVEALLEPYFVANTPMFLYRRFREIPLVRQIARAHAPSDLVAAWNELASKPDRSPEDVTRAYAALVALSFVEDHAAAKAALAGAHLDLLNWGLPIRDAVLGLYRPITRVEIQLNPSATIVAAPAPTGTSTSWAANLTVNTPNAQPAEQGAQPSLIVLGDRRR